MIILAFRPNKSMNKICDKIKSNVFLLKTEIRNDNLMLNERGLLNALNRQKKKKKNQIRITIRLLQMFACSVSSSTAYQY